MSCCACSSSSAEPFTLTLPLGSAPSWPFTLEDDSVTPAVPLDLTGADLWFAAKTAPTDADADAVLFASTLDGKLVITSATAGQGQIDLPAADTVETEALLPDRTYYAYLKVKLASGETRLRQGWVNTTPGGIEAPE